MAYSVFTSLDSNNGVYVKTSVRAVTGNEAMGVCTVQTMSDYVNKQVHTGDVSNGSIYTSKALVSGFSVDTNYMGSMGFSYLNGGITRLGGDSLTSTTLLDKMTADRTKFPLGNSLFPVVIGAGSPDGNFSASTFYNYYNSIFSGSSNILVNGLVSYGSASSNSFMKMASNASTGCYLFNDLDTGRNYNLYYSKGTNGEFQFRNSNAVKVTIDATNGKITGDSSSTSAISGFQKVSNYVWQDYADYVDVDDPLFSAVAGRCYVLDGGKYRMSDKKNERCVIGIHSDIYSYIAGCGSKDDEEGLGHGIAVSVTGFVLAYVDRMYPEGTPLTCGKDGALTKMGLLSRLFHPERLVATFWKEEKSETFHGKVVDGRCWVIVK